MSRILFISLLWLFCIGSSYSQIDTGERVAVLHRDVREATSDTARINAYITLGMHHVTKTYSNTPKALDSAIYYYDKSENLSRGVPYKRGTGFIYALGSRILKVKGDLKASEQAALKAVEILADNGSKNDLTTAYIYLAASAAEIRPPAESAVIFEKIYKLYKEMGNVRSAANTLLNVAYSHMAAGHLEKGLEELRESLALFGSVNEPPPIRLYSLLAIGNNELGNYDKAIEYGLMGVRLAEQQNDNGPLAGELYRYMGVIYTNMNIFDKAYEYCNKGYVIAKNYNYVDMATMLEGNIISLLVQLGRKKDALQYLIELQKKYTNLRPGVKETVVLTSIEIYTTLKEYDKAAKYIPEANRMLETFGPNDMRKMRFYDILSSYYYDSGQYALARKITVKAKALNEKYKDIEMLKRSHHMLFKLDSISADYASSIEHLKKYQEYKDSLLNTENAKTIARLQMQYDTEKKNKELLLKEQSNKLLKQKAELQENQLSRATITRNISLSAIVLLVLVLGLIYRRYRINQRIRREINLKNSTLQNLLNEKEWLLKEIHHRVKNNLQVVMSLLNTQSHFLHDDTAKAAIRNSQHRIHSMSLIHKKLYQSSNVVSVNMEVYIKELVEYFRSSFDTGQRIRFDLDIDPVELDSSKAVPLGLILNEAIVNSIKHAFPNNSEGTITIRLKCLSANTVQLTVKDNGKGIDGDITEKSFMSLGIKLIKGFSGELDATLDLIDDNGFGIVLMFSYDKRNYAPEAVKAIEMQN